MAFPAIEEFMNDSSFPSDAEFVDSDEPAIPWREVECGIPYQIVQTRILTTKNGEAMIITLQKRDGSTVNAWVTKLIENKLRNFNGEKKTKFIMSRGLKMAQKSKNNYYDFKIICK